MRTLKLETGGKKNHGWFQRAEKKTHRNEWYRELGAEPSQLRKKGKKMKGARQDMQSRENETAKKGGRGMILPIRGKERHLQTKRKTRKSGKYAGIKNWVP